MSSILKFKSQYFVLTVLLFLIELLIALFVNDNIIRPYIGDFLVVILIYCFIKSFFDASVRTTALSVLLFAYAVEFLQYCDIIEILGLQNSEFARIIIGTSFAWIDLIAYTAGIIIVLFIEKIINMRVRNK
ncbi:MAG: DUF2809 domain-containing protein [Bacteroidia bacterium]|nr:DUF2809 domain-containing protein [Bacteroidia bacterium]